MVHFFLGIIAIWGLIACEAGDQSDQRGTKATPPSAEDAAKSASTNPVAEAADAIGKPTAGSEDGTSDAAEPTRGSSDNLPATVAEDLEAKYSKQMTPEQRAEAISTVNTELAERGFDVVITEESLANPKELMQTLSDAGVDRATIMTMIADLHNKKQAGEAASQDDDPDGQRKDENGPNDAQQPPN